jgi:glutamine amidotransferase
MNWNSASPTGCRKNLPAHPYVYFVHSYHKIASADTPDVIATADYGQPVPAICGRDNVLGMQFHPEKSGPSGNSSCGMSSITS